MEDTSLDFHLSKSFSSRSQFHFPWFSWWDYYFTPFRFFTLRLPVIFYWSLNDKKSTQVSWTLHSILAYPNNTIVCIVSISPPTSISSKSFKTVPRAPVTVGITVTLIFHSFLNCLTKFKFLLNFSLSLIFHSAATGKSTMQQVLFLARFFPPVFADGLSLKSEW